jgi:hypothetical protein
MTSFSRAALMLALMGGLSKLGQIPSEIFNRQHRPSGTLSRRRSKSDPGEGKRGYYIGTGEKRQRVSRRPAAKFLPNVAGWRYEKGEMIRRGTRAP